MTTFEVVVYGLIALGTGFLLGLQAAELGVRIHRAIRRWRR